MRCEDCGYQNKGDEFFCQRCGSGLLRSRGHERCLENDPTYRKLEKQYKTMCSIRKKVGTVLIAFFLLVVAGFSNLIPMTAVRSILGLMYVMFNMFVIFSVVCAVLKKKMSPYHRDHGMKRR